MKKIILSIMIILMSITIQVSAKDLGSFNAGDSINQTKEIEATNFTAGNNVKVSSKIDGANFVAGNNISLSSSQDILFTAGNMINVESITTKDAFIAGSHIDIKNSTIRDLYAAAEVINIDSNINRNVYAGGESITINSRIDGDIHLAAERITIGEDAVITGKLIYPEEAKISISDNAQVNTKKTYKSSTTKEPSSIIEKVMNKTVPFISMLVTGLILIALNKRNTKQIEKLEKSFSNLAKQFGIGLLFLIVVPIASIFAMITVIGIPLSIITLIVYGILIYLSIIPASYYLGNWLLKDKIDNKYLIFAITLLVIYILKLLPIIAGTITLISLCIGLGIDIYLIKEHITTKK